jgi:hypothetical protein
MADWRYEGIICGYVALFRSTGRAVWLQRARQAGDDLVAAQLPSGKFRNSAFQQGPMEGGTPHEAAVDVGLLELAQVLRASGDEMWQKYFAAACRNIEEYLLGELWNGKGFRDQPWNKTLVPNKNATAIEALILFEALSGRDMSPYLDSAAMVILAAQEQTGPRAGATVHLGTGRHRLSIGIYTARSMCALLQMHRRHPDGKWLEAVDRGLFFLRGLSSLHGTHFGRYPDGTLIANPSLIAGSGDILRAMILGRSYGLASDADVEALVEVMARSQLLSWGIPTSFGMAKRGERLPFRGLPEFRDVLPVVGWCDKAFRALALIAPPVAVELTHLPGNEAQVECSWKGRSCIYRESPTKMQLLDTATRKEIYHWNKGECYPSIYQL